RLTIKLTVIKDLVNDSVLDSLFGRQNLIAVGINANLLRGTACVLRQGLFHQAAHTLNFRSLNLKVRNLALGALGCWLVDQNTRVRKRSTLSWRTCGK